MASSPRLAVPIRGPVVALCEGTHDAAFLGAIARRIGRADRVDLPFFEMRGGRVQQRERVSHGGGAMAEQLRAVALELRASPEDAARVSSILLLRDCGDDPAAVLNDTAAWCRAAGLAEPRAAGVWHRAAAGPQTALLLLPEPNGRGGLESLCLDHLRTRHPQAAQCLAAYFACIGPPEVTVTTENRAKAMLACLVAAIAPRNPTQTLSSIFDGTAPLIDVTAPVFTAVAEALAALLV